MNDFQIILTALITAILALIINNLIVRFKIYKLNKKNE